MNEDTHGSDKKNKPEEYLKRVDYGYIFRLTSGLYKPQIDHPEDIRDKDTSHDGKQIPILVTIHNKEGWVGNLIALIAVIVSILTLILLAATVYFAKQQWRETERTADAAICATNISSEALKLSRNQFAATQAAVLQPQLVTLGDGRTNPFTRAVNIVNVGHVAAIHVSGTITLFQATSRPKTIRFTDQVISDRSTSTSAPTGFMTKFFRLPQGMGHDALVAQKPRIVTQLNYWNGPENITQDFSACSIFSQYSNGDWVDCEAQDAYQ